MLFLRKPLHPWWMNLHGHWEAQACCHRPTRYTLCVSLPKTSPTSDNLLLGRCPCNDRYRMPNSELICAWKVLSLVPNPESFVRGQSDTIDLLKRRFYHHYSLFIRGGWVYMVMSGKLKHVAPPNYVYVVCKFAQKSPTLQDKAALVLMMFLLANSFFRCFGMLWPSSTGNWNHT